MAWGAAAILGTAAVVGFGTTAAVRVLRPRAMKALPPVACTEAWAPEQAFDRHVASGLSEPAALTLAQFQSFHLAPSAQDAALAFIDDYFGQVEEYEDVRGTVLAFPAVPGSSIDEGGQEVVVTTALERVENYRRFGAAVAAAALSPSCVWPPPFSREVPEQPRAAQVWQSLEQVATVALARRDEVQIEVDVDPIWTVLDDRLEACIDNELIHELRDPTTLAPEIDGDHDDPSWQLTHAAQIKAYQGLLADLGNPDVTAPISRTVVALAPRCPWGDKRYGLRMTTMWYDVRRLERLADAALFQEASP